MAFISSFSIETDEQEAARLAQFPEGSTFHDLASLPVTNPFPTNHQVLELPWDTLQPCSGQVHGKKHECSGTHRVVVVPLKFHGRSAKGQDLRLHNGAWDCRVVASDHPSYPAGGYDLSITESELRRSRVLAV